jgi:CRISPR/Cas system-associated exonuclease Cas4 (RecB family)
MNEILTPSKSLLVEKFKYKEFKRKNVDGQRYYVNSNGDPVPSVTSILSKTKDMTALNAWKKRVGAAEAQRIVTESANLGTIMHKHLESYIEGVERPSGTNQVYVQAKQLSETVIEHGLKNVDEVWGIETHLAFPGLYGGTADLICVHEGEPAIGDFKTSRKFKKKEWIDDYFMQASAYALAHNEVYGTNIQKGVIFMVTHDNQYQQFVVEGNEFQTFTDNWLDRVETYYKMNK